MRKDWEVNFMPVFVVVAASGTKSCCGSHKHTNPSLPTPGAGVVQNA